MAVIYLSIVSLGSFIFLVRIHYLELLDIKEFKSNIGDAKDLVEIFVKGFEVLKDFLEDTIKYFLLALVISVISLYVYVWGLRQPMRWKSYTLLLLGIALAWVGLLPLSESPTAFAGPEAIIQWVLIGFGHLYLVTSIWQFSRSIGDPQFFHDDKANADQPEGAMSKGFRYLVVSLLVIAAVAYTLLAGNSIQTNSTPMLSSQALTSTAVALPTLLAAPVIPSMNMGLGTFLLVTFCILPLVGVTIIIAINYKNWR